METSEAMPTGGAAAPDLADILRHEGPYLSLYLETAGDVETPRARSEQRWRSLRGSLEGADLPDDLLDTIGGIVADAHLQGPGLAVIATREEVRHVEHGSQPPRSDVALVADLPALGPLLGWRLHAPAHMVVLADRTGADIFGFRYGRPDIHREAEGDDLHVARSSPGGWSQRRFQERAENAWEENAEVAAAEVVRVAHAVDPRLIVVAGDVRAVNLLREALPPELATLIQEVGGGRAADGSREAIAEEAAKLVEVVAAQDLAELIKGFEQERGQEDKAIEGIAPTLRALAMAQVEVLLVDRTLGDERTAWFGPEAAHLSQRRDDVEGLGAAWVHEGPLVDACIRSALLSGARVAVVPPEAGIRDGLGALLRWST